MNHNCSTQQTYLTMNTATINLGPVFTATKRQQHPSKNVHDLGIEMTWGSPVNVARLYYNIREHAPKAFTYDFVSVYADDIIEDFVYQPYFARHTKLGIFYPLSAWLARLYEIGKVNRNIFATLAELDNILPKERPVTAEDDPFSPPTSS